MLFQVEILVVCCFLDVGCCLFAVLEMGPRSLLVLGKLCHWVKASMQPFGVLSVLHHSLLTTWSSLCYFDKITKSASCSQ